MFEIFAKTSVLGKGLVLGLLKMVTSSVIRARKRMSLG